MNRQDAKDAKKEEERVRGIVWGGVGVVLGRQKGELILRFVGNYQSQT